MANQNAQDRIADHSTTLKAFSRALAREAHVLTNRPDLLWQQLYNRLQWEGPPLADQLAAERARRSRPGATPWIHRYSRLRESEALVRTLTGHTQRVNACAVSPDGAWIVSAGGRHISGYDSAEYRRKADCTLRIWDAATGAELAMLSGHTGKVNGCAVSPDGTWIVSASQDNTLRIWDVATGTQRAILRGHTRDVNNCAVSPDGVWIVSVGAYGDGTLRIWDAASGEERAAFTVGNGGCNSEVSPLAVSPDGAWFFYNDSDDHNVRIWDVAAGAERALPGKRVCGKPGRRLDRLGANTVWDVATGAERATLAGHIERAAILCGEPGWRLDRLRQQRPHAQDLGCRQRRRTGHPHRPHQLGGRLCGKPRRRLDRLRQQRPHAQVLGRRPRRTGHAHRPHRHGEGLCGEPRRRLDRLRRRRPHPQNLGRRHRR